ncbi:MAG TPA: adenylate/guanylate cyclase domain-containing protein [Acidimicrobiales bacterium]|nr:adenylate/guanylate cyclase domain-containing protein [Acidimicrobiales bacterium]
MNRLSAVPSGTVTLLFTDIEGSTKLWESEPAEMADALRRHEAILRAAIESPGGYLFKTNGDAFCASFSTPSAAVEAVTSAQRSLTSEEWPTSQPLRVRMGLHSGVCEERDGDYFGPAVNRAARLTALAHGGQVLVSGATAELLFDSLAEGVELTDLGRHRLKDLGRPEHLFQLGATDLLDRFPPLASLDSPKVPNNLPAQMTTFVGRHGEIASLRSLIADHRLVTLTGAGGVGKSRLALQLAAEIVDGPADGVWWVELGPLGDPDRVAGAVAAVLGFREEQDRPLLGTLAGQLRDMDLVLVIDNCEHVLDATGSLIEALLLAAPRLRVVATSRESLGLAGETAWRVPSLEEGGAVELFIDRAGEARPGWRADVEATETIAHICRRLDGLPLAIELAAARTRMMNPVRIAAGLDDRFRLLTGGSRTAVPRQQTLEASVSWSHALLAEEERALLRRLSVFAGGFTLEGAEATCADGALVEEYAVLDLVSRLVDKSLIAFDENTGRYRLVETIAQFARERLVEAEEMAAIRLAHLSFYLDYAEQVEPLLVGGNGPTLLAQLELERDNLTVALEWAENSGADESLLRLVTALALFWVLRGHTADGGRWFSRALAHDDGPSVVRARALWGAAYVAIYGDDHETGDLCAPRALAMARDLDDPWTIARATNAYNYIALWRGPAQARADLARGVEMARSIGDWFAVADGLKMSTIAWQVEDDHDGAVADCEELLAVAKRLDNKFYEAWYHNVQALGALRRGEVVRARDECERSLELSRAVGDPSTAGVTLAWLGEVEALTGHHDEARARFETFLQRARATGGDQGFPFALLNLMTLLVGCGEADTAALLLGPLVARLRAEATRLPMIFAWALAVYGSALAGSDDEQAAQEALAEAERIAATANNPWLSGLVHHHLAQLATRQDNAERAEDLHHHALAIRQAHGLRPGVTESLEALAGLAVRRQEPTEAVRILAAVDRLRTELGFARWPTDQALYDGHLQSARTQLDEAGFAAAWAEGHLLGIDDVVSYATRTRGQRRRPTSGWSSLTPTESAVVELLAQGLTNPQIAERLFISRATVKTHLIHVFNKLGVSTRSQLAADATRRGAVSDASSSRGAPPQSTR